jgi:hypothetical protein
MAVENTPNPSTPPASAVTVALSALYPHWWGSAATVRIDTVTLGNVICDVGDVELFPHGVSMPDVAPDWDAAIIPWHQITNVHKAS